MKNQIYIVLFLLVSSLGLAQETTITKSGNYTVTVADSLVATDYILFLPDAHIKEGSIFSARISALNTALDAYTPFTFPERNYVFNRVFQTAMDNFNAATAKEGDVIESISYLDGLGRPLQQVGIKASPVKRDIVAHSEYDVIGRSPQQFLPYEATTGVLASLRADAKTATSSHYGTHYPKDIPNGAENPFSQMEYEPSPLKRILNQSAPGSDWRMGGGQEIKMAYGANAVNKVRCFEAMSEFEQGIN